jgi:hypothetical protein
MRITKIICRILIFAFAVFFIVSAFMGESLVYYQYFTDNALWITPLIIVVYIVLLIFA